MNSGGSLDSRPAAPTTALRAPYRAAGPGTGPRANPSSHLHPAPHLPPSQGAWLRTPTLHEPPDPHGPGPHPQPHPRPQPRPQPHPHPDPTSLRKKVTKLNAAKAAKAAQEKADDAKGLPKWNLFRALPKQTKQETRSIDGSFRFPKPWGKGTWD